MTVLDLMRHTSGVTYGFYGDSLVRKAYRDADIYAGDFDLAEFAERIAKLPLHNQPGALWQYGHSTDILARVMEIATGKPLLEIEREKLLGPLGMVDTGFFVPPAEQGRLVAYYRGADVLDPMKPGLRRIDDLPYPQAYRKPVARLSGGGGLVTTLPDMLALVRALLPGPDGLLKPETVRQMMTNQLPDGQTIRFATLGPIPGKAFGLGGAVTFAPAPFDPPNSTGEFQWGGLAGTHWWICPQAGMAGVLMAQRQMGFWNPFFFEFKRLAYAAAGAA
jgi:CubicO group peptidase (beta-lactamase class C family)